MTVMFILFSTAALVILAVVRPVLPRQNWYVACLRYIFKRDTPVLLNGGRRLGRMEFVKL